MPHQVHEHDSPSFEGMVDGHDVSVYPQDHRFAKAYDAYECAFVRPPEQEVRVFTRAHKDALWEEQKE